MSPISFRHWLPTCGIVSLALAFVQPANAQLAISLDDGGVSVQNGNQPPLVVGPGQSFGGTLTPNGFQGVISDSRGTRTLQPGMMNPFMDARSKKPLKSQPMKINAGGITVALPGTVAPPAIAAEPMTPAQWAMLKQMARTAEPMAVLAEVDQMLLRSPSNPDLLQLKAMMLMREYRPKEAAACVYETLAQDTVWTWPMLRSCFATREKAEAMYRDMQREMQEKPLAERQFVMAWWERMLRHDRQAVECLELAMEAYPADRLMPKLYEIWSESLESEVPPAALP